MRAAGSGDSAEAAAEQPWKKFVYVEPSRRVKEILEEELYIQEEAWRVKHPAAVAVEGIWSLKKNFNIGSLKPVSQNRNGLLLQPQFYSRHAGRKTLTNSNVWKSPPSNTPPEKRLMGDLATLKPRTDLWYHTHPVTVLAGVRLKPNREETGTCDQHVHMTTSQSS